MRITHPGDLKNFMHHLDNIDKNHDCGELDFRILTQDGQTRWIAHICTEVFDNEGKSIGRRISNRDITERKLAEKASHESELKFRELFQNVADPVYICDSHGKIIAANDQACIEMGYTLDELLQRQISDLDAVFNTPEKTASHIEELYKTGLATFETTHQRKDGSKFPVEIKSRVIDIEGQQCLLGVAGNLTDRKRIEEDRFKIEKKLQQAQKMEAIGTLAGGIAHDFNNILGAIIGYAEMAEEDSLEGSLLKKDIEQVLKASYRAKDLVKQILTFSRYTETQRTPVQLAVLIKETAKMLRSSIPTTIDIRQDIHLDTGLVLADPTQIHQILMNLCTNAFHAMEETGGTLTITLKRKFLSQHDLPIGQHIQSGEFVQISIADTGSGIAPDIGVKIFEPYFTTKETGKGTGMGLAIVHGIVKAYGGFITCQSQPGEGTVFDVYLPVIEDIALLEIESPSIPQLGSEHILYIDDEETLAVMGKDMLERLGYRVATETSSIEALSIFRDQPNTYDLVITDQTMPEMTGVDLARRMLQIRPDLPIILCTGYSSQVSEEKAKAFGIKGFAMKPLARKDIAVLIRNVLDAQKSNS